ncbi:MAG: stage III sporulation protein AB [Candidatus Fimenecus sp.]
MMCEQVHKRIRELDAFIRLFTVIKTQIAYTMQPTDALLRYLCQTAEFTDFSFVFFLNDIFADGHPFTSAWKQALAKYTEQSALQATDVDLLCAFGEGFGTTDKDGQIANCTYYITRLTEFVTELKKNEKNASRLYLSLGTLGGLFFTILLL